ncbi:unnamed protein product [Effrenium voratum]|nr:unnamed protein product [Effrenium voratum]
MRSILNMLLSSKLQGVSETLSAQPPEVLKAMVQWLLCTCSRSSASLEDGDAKESSSRNRPKFTGIHRDKAGHGYSAYMYFEKLKARDSAAGRGEQMLTCPKGSIDRRTRAKQAKELTGSMIWMAQGT